MNVDNLVAMANQIGQFFEAMPDRTEALDGISSHLKKFWAPRMRHALTNHWHEDGGPGLSPIVIAALTAHPIVAPAAPADPADPRDPMRGTGSHELDGATEA